MRISVRTFAPNSIPIRFETTEPYYFWRTRPNNKKDKNNNSTLLKFIETTPNNKMSSDMRSVPTSCSKMVAYDGIKYCSCTISVKSRKRRRWEHVMHGWTAIINICRPKKYAEVSCVSAASISLFAGCRFTTHDVVWSQFPGWHQLQRRPVRAHRPACQRHVGR